MDDAEKRFRSTPLGHKKRNKRLYEFIRYLIDKGRLLEARYYFQSLIQDRPDNLNNNALGYEISIKTFDNDGVVKFDRFLCDNSRKPIYVQCLQLEYYYSINYVNGFSFVLNSLLANDLKHEVLIKIINLVIGLESYTSIAMLLSYLKRKRLKLNKEADVRIKKVVLQKFADTLVRVKL